MITPIPSGWCTSTFLFYLFRNGTILPGSYQFAFAREESNVAPTLLTLTGNAAPNILTSDSLTTIQNKFATPGYILNPLTTIINVISYDPIDNGLLITLSMPSSSIVNPSIKALGNFYQNVG